MERHDTPVRIPQTGLQMDNLIADPVGVEVVDNFR
jgi:hypothetical protein